MEFGETQIQSLHREVLEETEIEVIKASLLAVEDGLEDSRTHVVLMAFLVNSWRGVPKARDDASEIGWFNLDCLPGDIAWLSHAKVLEEARQRVLS